jgi:hydroxymethylpyrimidine/phosphomethylpyrimidine kinase
MSEKKGRVLIIAGSDSGGGAGIQADIKTVTAFGGFAMTAVTAITVQNTLGVTAVHPIPLDIVVAQMDAVLSDLGADVIKTGMLGTAQTVETIAAALDQRAPGFSVIVDPVMIAKGGQPLLAEDAIGAMRSQLVARAALVTPNAPEAAALVGFGIATAQDQDRAAEALLNLGARAALVKGGHLDGETVRDVLATSAGLAVFESPRLRVRATHGTGCTLASAIAAQVAQGAQLDEAVRHGREYVFQAMRTAPGFGAGHAPLNHAWPFRMQS